MVGSSLSGGGVGSGKRKRVGVGSSLGGTKVSAPGKPPGPSNLMRALAVLDAPRRGVVAAVDSAITGDSLGENWRENKGVGDYVNTGNKWLDRALGLAGDIATDPLSYLTLGASSGAKLAVKGAGKAVTKGKVQARDIARQAVKEGDEELAERVLSRGRRGSVNALTAEEAAKYGVRQGPTFGVGKARAALPGGDKLARTVSDALSKAGTERLAKTRIGTGLTAKVEDITPLQRLQAKDANRANRLEAKGTKAMALTNLNRIVQQNKDTYDPQRVRDAMEGVGDADPVAAQLSQILDDVHTWAEKKLGRELPRRENYLSHRLEDDARDMRIDQGGANVQRTKRPTVLQTRGYQAGDTFYGITLKDASISEMNKIFKEVTERKHNYFKDNPVEIAKQYVDDITSTVAKSEAAFATEIIERTGKGGLAPLKEKAAPGAPAAAKEVKQLDKALAKTNKILEDNRVAREKKLAAAAEKGDEAARLQLEAERTGLQELVVRREAARIEVAAKLKPQAIDLARQNVDPVFIAKDAEALTDVAADNAKKLDIIGGVPVSKDRLRVEKFKRAEEERVLREDAMRLYDAAAAARAAGDEDLAEVAALQAEARRLEAELPDLDRKFQKAMALSNRTVTYRNTKAMTSRGLVELADGRFAEPWVAEVAKELADAMSQENVGRLLKEFDRFSGWWRASALLSPGYHSRNFQGALFNNMLAGMDWARYPEYRRTLSQYKKGGTAAITDPDLREAWEHAERLALLGGEDISDVTKIIGMEEGGNIVGRNNALFKLNFKAAARVEAAARVPLFVDAYLKSGKNVDSALDTVMKYHFDYDDLSKMERTVGRRAFGFYTWARNNLPLMLAEAADSPGKFTRYAHLKRNMELGQEDDPQKPGYFNKLMAVAVPGATWKGNQIYMTPDLPFISAAGTTAEGSSGMLANLNPLIKLPLEHTTNRKFFENRNFSDTLRPVDSNPIMSAMLNALAVLPKNTPGVPKVYRGKDGSVLMDEREMNKIESLMPLASRLRRLWPNEEKYEERWLTSMLSFMGGVGMRTLDEPTRGGEMQRRKTEATKKEGRQAKIEGGRKLADYEAAQRRAKAIKAANEGR